MKKTLTTIFIFSLIFGCSNDKDSPKPISTSINKIMTLGASRVEGSRPDYESFRYNLWKNMIENNWTFDFIGTQSDEPPTLLSMGLILILIMKEEAGGHQVKY